MTGTRSIHRLAIVNRGEAAMRCIRAAKALRALEGSDLVAIALYTDVDKDAPFVRHADVVHRLPQRGTAVSSYLDHELLLQALRDVKADAVWPGWGFVAEDNVFADKLAEAGITFLGPTGETMRQLGDKISSKRLAEEAEVPVTAWSKGEVVSVEEALRCAEEIGYPVVVKASAGGGGRGIRMVDDPAELPAAFESAGSEARNAFGDGRLFIEGKVTGGRHIEVQIVADQHGQVAAVGCRDCSVQRRHQKVIEEAPPVKMRPETIRALKDCAVRLAASVGYAGVGTVEFLVVEPEIFFLEINPRLQVEHGITEAITGIDLVQAQIRIARGERLPTTEFVEQGVAIEARVCAEDPDAGFLPAPGRIACFDPALGPQIRIDSGVVAGSSVPADFDSLIAKVVAVGSTREEARARLACALSDFDLVIEGGATNKGYLIDLLEAKEYREGGVDTLWLDRWGASRAGLQDYAVEALVVASLLAYRQVRKAALINFYSDPAGASPASAPASVGQQIDLTYGGEQYRMDVFALGAWRYRLHLEGKSVSAMLQEEGANAARLQICGRFLRVVFDVTETNIRVEVEGRPHRFGRQTAGQVRAGTPSTVVAVHFASGDEVQAGQSLGLLEAMKMEIGFDAPVSGVVTEVLVQKGQQVAAGDVLMVIEPASEDGEVEEATTRLTVPEEEDALALLFVKGPDGVLGEPDLSTVGRAEEQLRYSAMLAVQEEIRRILLGYDANPARVEALITFLEVPLPDDLTEDFRRELAQISSGVSLFADVEELFIRTPRASVSGTAGPSNNARLRIFLRRIMEEGEGLPEEFLTLLRRSLSHYGVHGLTYDANLQRATLRLFSSQRDPELRIRLVNGIIRRVMRVAESGVDLAGDTELAYSLTRIGTMRGRLSNALADRAIEARYSIFQRPAIAREAERTTYALEQWLTRAAEEPTPPPLDVLDHLANAPKGVFDRVGKWVRDPNPRYRRIALAVLLRRFYAPRAAVELEQQPPEDDVIEVLRVEDVGVVISALAAKDRLPEEFVRISQGLQPLDAKAAAIEILVPLDCEEEISALRAVSAHCLAGGMHTERLTLTCLLPDCDHHFTWVAKEDSFEEIELHGLHPEAALRVDLERYRNFELERLPGFDGVYCFFGKAREVPEDQRLFVLADVRGMEPGGGPLHAAALIPAFEKAFYEATRSLRMNIGLRDPRRRLKWNRIALYLTQDLVLDSETVDGIAKRLAPATRHLGIEKVVVRMIALRDGGALEKPAREMEIVLADPTGSLLEMSWRPVHQVPLQPAAAYERNVVAARSRGLLYPYEIIRMLTNTTAETDEVATDVIEGAVAELRNGSFEEFDLNPSYSTPQAISVAGRPYGKNESSVVFGLISTPTEKVPEGMRRVLLLSDPTKGMGSLAVPECDRIVAAIDLAEQLRIPVEWVPVSSGAHIAMDSGTENLDATARVVRRIVTFTQGGGVIHLIVQGVNVGAQSYWDALSTMLMHTRGVLIMTPGGSMVLTGRAALAASGSVSAEDEAAIGGYERIMGPNGQAQYYAEDLGDAYRILYDYYGFAYVVPGESGPRSRTTEDPPERSITESPYQVEGHDFATVGDIFDDHTNPGRKKPFAMRPIMHAVVDRDGGFLERWSTITGGETAIIWDAHIGGAPVCLIGIESQNVSRWGYRPSDGPPDWNGGTLFPLSSKKVARALNAASGNRPVVILANLSGFDGSPESMRKLQLEYGAEIARAVVNFEGPIVFSVVSRYHGGAYVVFSQDLNPNLHASALEGSYASVIGGGPAASVVFPREVRGRMASDPRVIEFQTRIGSRGSEDEREELERLKQEVLLEKQAELAAEFDGVHSVQRALEVGSIQEILPASRIRPFLIEQLERARG